MGTITAPKECFITGAPTTDHSSNRHKIEYYTEYAGQKFFFCFSPDHLNSKVVDENKYILQGLIINRKFPYDDEESTFNNDKLEKIIREANVPKAPKEKLDNLIMFLFSAQKFEGSEINIDSNGGLELVLQKLYFKNQKEYWFYLSTLRNLGFIDFIDASPKDGNDAMNIHLTYSGLEYVINLQESGEKSKKCFIAMHFTETMAETRETIKEIVKTCGYQPILIDEVNYESEITINDALIRNIKECKFLIADFSGQRHGVYFEAGYALGKGRQVIYLCCEDDFKNTHFDINHYPHIVYTDTNDLKTKLTNKIKAWID
jgi:nucleoside 2-deoxyribosyltransferase